MTDLKMIQSSRTIFLGVSIAVLTACSNPTQSSNAPMPGMDHSKMDHSQMNHGSMTMELGAADENFDLRFIDAMVPHHQGAVKMAQEALQKSKRPEIKKLAQSIIADQDQEIAQMQQWRKSWYASAAATPMAWNTGTKTMMPMTQAQMKSMMMEMNLGAADDQFDLRFINAMIPHHQSAIDMANNALKASKRPEIQKLSSAIKTSQQAEIAQMKQWQKAWYSQ
jgi:uncharacterized protein (DUF305 family)